MASRGLSSAGWLVLAGAAAGPAAAEAVAAAAGNVVPYPAGFYDQFRPAHARDMIERTPGFTINHGRSGRGLSGAAGNVLIDGERSASKAVSLDQLLQRIPATAVERIEVIRGGAPGVDMQGHAVLANVVRKPGATSSLVAQVLGKVYRSGFEAFVAQAEGGRRIGALDLEGQAQARRDLFGDSGGGSIVRRRAGAATPEEGALELRGVSRFYEVNGAAEHRGGYGRLRLNAAGEHEIVTRRDEVRPDGLAVERADQRVRKDGLELGGEFEGDLFGAADLQIVGLQRLGWETVQASSLTGSGVSISEKDVSDGEWVLRSVVRRELGGGGSLEAGAEGAFNFLDASSALSQNGAAVELPSANVRVEERRSEVFAATSVRPTATLTLAGALRVETSTIRQTGGAEREKTLTFAKPQATASWEAGSWQTRVRAERIVGQLNFDDFAASSDLGLGTVNVGNAELEPERSWLFEAAVERRFWGNGAITLTLSHAEVDHVVDLIPIDGRFDAPGNIGSGRRRQARLSLTAPLDRLGLTDAQLRLNGTWRASQVDDPVTGEARRISHERPFEGHLFLSKSVPGLQSSLAFEASMGFRETAYRINEVRTTEETPTLRAYWDWTPRPDLLFRFQYENLTDRRRVRERTGFAGPRSLGPVNLQEQRVVKLGPSTMVRVRKMF